MVDVMREVVLIPDDGNCKPFDGWFAMSEPAVRQLRYNQIQHQKQADLAVLLCNTARQGAEAVAREMTVERDNAIWWQRYAPVLIGLAAVLAGSAGAVLGFELGRK